MFGMRFSALSKVCEKVMESFLDRQGDVVRDLRVGLLVSLVLL